MQLNFGEAKERFKPFANNGTCDPELVGRELNRALDRLVNSGKWVNTIRRIAFCEQSGCITLPRDVESVLEMSGRCGMPITVMNQWYEFLPGGPFQLSNCNKPCDIAADRGDGHVLAFEVTGDKYIRVYADLPEAAGAKILLQGYDENGNRVQTFVDGEWVDGEYVGINNATPQLSTTKFSQITSVKKPLTNGYVRMYQVKPDTLANDGLIAMYHPNDIIPSYRRYYFPSICASETHPRPVVTLCKMRFNTLVRDTDLLPITCVPAIEHMLMAIYFFGSERMDLGQQHEAKALQYLNDELKQFQAGGKGVPKYRVNGFYNRPPVQFRM